MGAGQKRERGGQHLASRHDVEAIFNIMLNCLRSGSRAAEDFGEPRAIIRPEKFSQRRVTQVAVNQ